MARGLVALVALSTLAACERRATQEECARMLDKYLDMTLGGAEDLRRMPESQAAIVREARKTNAKSHPAYRKVETQCTAEVRRGQYDCAMAAHNADEWQACVD